MDIWDHLISGVKPVFGQDMLFRIPALLAITVLNMPTAKWLTTWDPTARYAGRLTPTPWLTLTLGLLMLWLFASAGPSQSP